MNLKYFILGTLVSSSLSALAVPLGHLGMGVTAKEDASGEGYILFNPSGIGADRPNFLGSSNNFLAVYRTSSGWFYYQNETAISFLPKQNDLLVASVNYSTDSVLMLSGTRSLIHGVNSGYVTGDLVIEANRYDGGPNPGEFGLSGTEIEFHQDPEWRIDGTFGQGVTAKESASGSGYILFNPKGVGADRPMHPDSSTHFLAVYQQGNNWFYYQNEEARQFDPQRGDVLVAEVNFSNDTVTSLEGVRSAVGGIFSGYASGDLVITPNQYGGIGNPGEFGLAGTVIKLNQCPDWWLQKNVIIEGVDNVDHYASATIGQAKWIARGAWESIEQVSPSLAASIRLDLAGAPETHPFSVWPPPIAPDGGDSAVLLVGQLKAISGPFYKNLNELVPEWLENEMAINGTRQTGTFYPWGADIGESNNRGIANLGQLKVLFTLRFADLVNHIDTDGDGLLDSFELVIINADPTDGVTSFADVLPTDDFDGDFLTNIEEAQASSDPTSPEGGYVWNSIEWRGFESTTASDPVDVPGTILTRPSGEGWNAGAFSKKMMGGDGAIQFRFGQTNKYVMCGLSEASGSSSYVELKYAIYGRNNGQVAIWENGNEVASIGAYSSSDTFEIRRTGTAVTYYRNGTLIHPSNQQANRPLFADVSIYSTAASIVRCGQRGFSNLDGDQDGLLDSWESQLVATSADITNISEVAPSGDLDEDHRSNVIEYLTESDALTPEHDDWSGVVWKDLVLTESGTTPNLPGSSLTKPSGASGWNADAISSSILSADGEVRFRFLTNTGAAMCGLSLVSSGNSSRSFTDIDYAIYGLANGTVRIYEKGTHINTVPAKSYGVSDDFSVRRIGDTVSYYKNGVSFYDSKVKTTASLEVDTSFRTSGSGIYSCGKRGFGFDLTDSDEDGIADGWEEFFFGDLTTANATSDFDSDGISDLFEYQAMTDPKVDQTAVESNRTNYTYTKTGRLDDVTGEVTFSYEFDDEGNLTSASTN